MTTSHCDTPAATNPDGFTIEMAVDPARGRVAACWTSGLASFGFPELAIVHDPEQDEDDLEDDEEEDFDDDFSFARRPSTQQALRSGQMLVLLGRDVLDAQTLDIPPRHEEVNGLPVRFWLGKAERPAGGLALALPDSEQVIPVRWVIG